MAQKLINGVDEAEWLKLKVWCMQKRIKIGEGLNRVLRSHFKK